MTTKKIERVVAPPAPHMVGDGFRVHNFIPAVEGLSMERMSPFILMDYNSKVHFQARENPRGVGVHPHRGFETVTIAYKGKVAHHDSKGHHGIIGEGDVQWMTAASGVLHKEYHEKEFSKAGGEFQMVQLWINLPADQKMSEPKYQTVLRRDMGVYHLENELGKIEIIAGEYNGIKGAASTFTPLNMYNARMKHNAKAEFSFPASYNTVLLVIEGKAEVDGTVVPENHLLVFGNEGENFLVKALEDSIFLVLSGEPIREPIAAYGPFVMNTREEILQAYDDLNKGKFGYLEK